MNAGEGIKGDLRLKIDYFSSLANLWGPNVFFRYYHAFRCLVRILVPPCVWSSHFGQIILGNCVIHDRGADPPGHDRLSAVAQSASDGPDAAAGNRAEYATPIAQEDGTLIDFRGRQG